MKTAIILIIIGGFLLVEGGSRITIGLIASNMGAILGGLATGVALGGFLLYKGIRRYAKIKREGVIGDAKTNSGKERIH